jgi:hypothetical protein
MEGERIRHTVAFTLVHGEGSAGERDFLAAAERLASVPGVEAFELLAEVSPKNGYRYLEPHGSALAARSGCSVLVAWQPARRRQQTKA